MESTPKITDIMHILTQILGEVKEIKEQMAELDHRVTDLECYDQDFYENMEEEHNQEDATEEPTAETNIPPTKPNQDIQDIRNKQNHLFSSMDNIQSNMHRMMEALDELTPSVSNRTLPKKQ